MENPDIAACYLRRYMDEEGTPSLEPLPIDFDAYKDSLIRRFSNPEIRDTLARLARILLTGSPNGSFPVIGDNLVSVHRWRSSPRCRSPGQVCRRQR